MISDDARLLLDMWRAFEASGWTYHCFTSHQIGIQVDMEYGSRWATVIDWDVKARVSWNVRVGQTAIGSRGWRETTLAAESVREAVDLVAALTGVGQHLTTGAQLAMSARAALDADDVDTTAGEAPDAQPARIADLEARIRRLEAELALSTSAVGAYQRSKEDLKRRLSDALLLVDRLVERSEELATDLRESRQSESAAQHEADHCPHTGLLNRRGFAAAYRARPQQTMVLLDLDRFKDVNDWWGHDVGDAVISAVAETLEETVAEAGDVARLGGDEFAILLYVDDAVRFAAHLKDQVSRTMVDAVDRFGEPVAIRVTCSVGVTHVAGVEYGAEGQLEQLSEPMRRADMALYAAKDHGGNSLVLWREDLPLPGRTIRRVCRDAVRVA